MKSLQKQSINVEDQRGNSSATAFKSNPKVNPALVRVKKEREQEYADESNGAIANTMAGNSPFKDMLKDMSKPLPKQSSNASIPIPTARPDPSQPYGPNGKPKVFTNLTGYTSQVTPGDFQELK